MNMFYGNPLFGVSPIQKMASQTRDRGYYYDRGFKFGVTGKSYYSFHSLCPEVFREAWESGKRDGEKQKQSAKP